MAAYSSSYWEQDSLLKPYDLIIIGAGITGLMSALFYSRKFPHHRTVILERGFIPKGASTRNAGFACIGSIGEHLADLQKTSQEDILTRLKRRYEGLRLLRSTLGDDAIGYNACGGYELFTSQEKFREAAGEIDHFNELTASLLGETAVYKAQELNGYPVIYNRLEGALHPAKMMQQLIFRVQEAGVDIKWNTKVKEVSTEGRVLLAGSPPLEGEKILFATNAFTQRLLPQENIQPGRGYAFITNEQQDLKWRGTFHHDRGYLYFRNVGNRLLIGGARNLAEEEEQTDAFGYNDIIKEHLTQFTSDILRLPDWQIHREWSGIMGFTSSKTPVLKKLDKHRYIAAGLSGMGIAIGSQIGKEAADLLS